MAAYTNYLKTIFLFMAVLVFFQGCFFDKQQDVKLDKAEKRKLAKQKLHENIEEEHPDNYALAQTSGYKGYVEYKSIEKFISEYEYGRIDINDYKNYIISNTARGTYAYKFSKLINETEVYQPNSKYGWVHAVGIKREKGQTDELRVGSPMRDTQVVRFLGISNYKTIYGVYKKILVFDRATKFRAASEKNIQK